MFLKNLLDLILISQLSILVPILSWILFVRKASLPLYLILASVIVGSLEEILSYVFAYRYQNNLIILNTFTLPTLMLLYLAYGLKADLSPPVRRVIGITGLAGFLLILYGLLTHDIHTFIVFNKVVYAFALVLLALYHFVDKVFYSKEFDILHQPFFIISCGLFVYYLSVFTIYLVYDMDLGPGNYEKLWSMKLVVFILYNFTLAYSFHIFKKHRNTL